MLLLLPALGLAGTGSALALTSSEGAPLVRADLTVTGANGIVTVIPTVTPPPISHPILPQPPRSSMSLTTSPGAVVAGVPFTLTLTESGGSGQNASEEIFGFGPQLTVESAASSQGTCDSTSSQEQVTCALGTVNSGGNVVVNLTLLALAPGTFSVSAFIPGVVNTAATSIVVGSQTADVAVNVPPVTLRPKLGGRVRAGITVGDAGPFAAGEVVLTVAVPRELRLVDVTADVTCSSKPLVCRFPSLAMGQKELVVLTFAAAHIGKGSVTASVSGNLGDPVGSNNRGAMTVSVKRLPAGR